MDNVIKQGYLKRAKPTPATRKSVASQILQMFEPQRWYVLGLRGGRPYLEFYDKEEHVFSEQPINTFDLGRCQRLTYTLGRTNKNWTFCLFLHERVIELTAESRNQMLDWCRVLERTLHNYGSLRKTDSEHVYSEFPIPYVPKKSEEVDEVDGVSVDINQNSLAGQSEAASGSRENTPINSPVMQEEEIIFGSQFTVMEAISQGASNVNTVDLNDDTVGDLDGVVYRRKISLKAEGNTSETDTSEDDFVTSEFWLTNKLPPVPKRNFPPPIPDRPLSLVLPKAGSSVDEGELTPTETSVDQNFFDKRLKKDDDKPKKSHSAPVTLSAFQLSIPPIPPRRNKRSLEQKNLGNEEEPALGGGSMNGATCSDGHKSVNNSNSGCQDNQNSVGDLDDGYQSILEVRPHGPMFISSQKTKTDKLSISNGPAVAGSACGSVDDCNQRAGKVEVNLPETNSRVDPQNHQETQRGITHAPTIVSARVDRINKKPEENFYTAFPVSERTDFDIQNSDVESTNPKVGIARLGELDSSHLTESSSDDPAKVSKNKVINKTRPPEPPPLETLPKDHQNQSHVDISPPPRVKKEVSSAVLPNLPSLDTLPTKKLSSDHTISLEKSCVDHPIPPSVDTLPKRNISPSHLKEYSKPLKRSPSDPLNSVGPPPRKPPEVSRKISSSVKMQQGALSVMSRPLPSLPTDDDDTATNAINGRSSPTFDDFRFDSKKSDVSPSNVYPSTKSGFSPPSLLKSTKSSSSPTDTLTGNRSSSSSSSSNHSASEVEAAVASCNDYEDATMRNKPPVIPPRLTLDRRSQSVYIPPSREKPEVNNNAANGDDKMGKGIVRQISLQDRQRINRSSGAFTVVPLKQSQAEILKEEQDLHAVTVPMHCKSGPRVGLVDCYQGVWVAGWDFKLCPRLSDKLHIGDELIKINETRILNSAQAFKLMKHSKGDSDTMNFVVRRIPYGKVVPMRRTHEKEPVGLHREGGTAVITYIDPVGLAAKGGLEKKAKSIEDGSPSNWMITEINNRPLNLSFKGSEIEHLLNAVGRDISVVVQPEDFVKTLKKNLKKFKNYKDYLAPS